MATYVVFGKYGAEAIRGISPERTEQAAALVKAHGGEIKAGYALLGETDLLFIVDFPDNESAMKASVALARLTGIGFVTAPAVTIADFDRLVAGA